MLGAAQACVLRTVLFMGASFLSSFVETEWGRYQRKLFLEMKISRIRPVCGKLCNISLLNFYPKHAIVNTQVLANVN